MFGTRTRGFAIITTLISCRTYAIAFGLLHPPSHQFTTAFLSKTLLLASLRKGNQDVLNSLKGTIQGNFRNRIPSTAPKAEKGEKIEKDEGDSLSIHMATASARKGKGKETATEKEVPDSGLQARVVASTECKGKIEYRDIGQEFDILAEFCRYPSFLYTGEIENLLSVRDSLMEGNVHYLPRRGASPHDPELL
jgi:hypothetical protein